MSVHSQRRPMPEGFPADAFTMSAPELKRKYRAGDPAIRRWRNEVGLDPRPPQFVPPPADFAELAKTRTQKELKAHYGVGSTRVSTWAKLTGASPVNGRVVRITRRKPVPDDFAEIAPMMTKTALQRHYGCYWETMERWLAETGAVPCKFVPIPPKRTGYNFRPRTRLASSSRNYTALDEAADILRHYFPVYRCDDRGLADEKGKFWRVGNVRVDGDELLARAARKRVAA